MLKRRLRFFRWTMDVLLNIARGMGSVLVLRPPTSTSFPRDLIQTSDIEAMREDWQHVGDDLRNAIDRYQKEKE